MTHELPRIELKERWSFEYKNHEGKIADRKADIVYVRYGINDPYHKDPQWLAGGFDVERNVFREFAMKDMKHVRREGNPVG